MRLGTVRRLRPIDLRELIAFTLAIVSDSHHDDGRRNRRGRPQQRPRPALSRPLPRGRDLLSGRRRQFARRLDGRRRLLAATEHFALCTPQHAGGKVLFQSRPRQQVQIAPQRAQFVDDLAELGVLSQLLLEAGLLVGGQFAVEIAADSLVVVKRFHGDRRTGC